MPEGTETAEPADGLKSGEKVDTRTGEITLEAAALLRFGPAGAVPVQGTLPGVMPTTTRSHMRAEEVARQRVMVKIAKEKLKDLERNLMYAMHDDKIQSVKVRDEAGFLHEFTLENLERIRYESYG